MTTVQPRCSNITSVGERRRRMSGYAALGAGVLVLAGLAWRDARSVAYFALLPFAVGAAFGLLQARAKTCVVFGLQGIEEVDGGGIRKVADAEVRAQARRQAKKVLWESLGLGLLVTLLAVVASGLTFTA
jgi:hypothetical protein